MEVFGIKFAPINIPLHRRLETLAAAAGFVLIGLGGPIGVFFTIYLMLYSRFWLVTLIYLMWAWGVDRQTGEQGGRSIKWVRDWAWWKYLKDYFPLKLVRVPGVELDPKRNYLCCCFPHGLISAGPFAAFLTNAVGFHELFPNHKPYLLTLAQHFHTPFFRELALSLGGCSASANSINHILSIPGGGNAPALVVGGVAETYNCIPGQYRLILKNRKGFVKLALKNGAPLVPVFSFGENDIYSQVNSPEGSLLRRIQESIRKVIGQAPNLVQGRGFFQYSFGIIPFRKPITVVVGKPLDVEKIENPTREEVDAVHQKFIACLIELFEEQKHNYVKDPDNAIISIE